VSELTHGRVLRACLVCGAPSPGRRCGRHQAEADARRAAYERQRGSAHERGYTYAYTKLRRQVLAEELYCGVCGEPAERTDPFVVDHITPLSAGGENERGNLRACHATCNSRRRSFGRRVRTSP
jgi:5-methylcytosine-specific restriction protein A